MLFIGIDYLFFFNALVGMLSFFFLFAVCVMLAGSFNLYVEQSTVFFIRMIVWELLKKLLNEGFFFFFRSNTIFLFRSLLFGNSLKKSGVVRNCYCWPNFYTSKLFFFYYFLLKSEILFSFVKKYVTVKNIGLFFADTAVRNFYVVFSESTTV